MKQIINEMPWVDTGDVAIDFQLENCHSRDEVLDRIRLKIDKLDKGIRDKVIEDLFVNFSVVMKAWDVDRSDLVL